MAMWQEREELWVGRGGEAMPARPMKVFIHLTHKVGAAGCVFLFGW